MCIGLPARLVEITGPGVGVAEVRGRRVEINLAFVPAATVGSWVVAHSGIAVRLVAAAEAAARRELIERARECGG